MAKNDSTSKTVIVALVLCVVCSMVVSTAAVVLKPAQQVNKTLDLKRNVLAAAGLLEEGADVEEAFSKITAKVVDLRTGKFTNEVDAASYQQRKAEKDPAMSTKLGEKDIAKIGSREHFSLVYLVEANGKIQKVILPVRGYGLWSTLRGFMALENDFNTVIGLGFYEHAETPGLGGEVDNPRWKAFWPGKKVYKSGDVALGLIKGTVDTSRPEAVHQVDGLAGATLTSRGVTNLVHFWLGEEGFAPFLKNLKAGEA